MANELGGGGGGDCVDEFVRTLDAYAQALSDARDLAAPLRRLPRDQACAIAGEILERLAHVGDLTREIGRW